MAYKILWQSKPSGTSNTTLYTVPAWKSTVTSSITIANTTATADTFRIHIVPSWQSVGDTYVFAKDSGILGNDTITATVGFTLGEWDFINVYSWSWNVAFAVYGNEV